MASSDIFARSLLVTKIKLKPHLVAKNVDKMLLRRLQNKMEGVCSHYGYIKPGSIKIYKYSMGMIPGLYF